MRYENYREIPIAVLRDALSYCPNSGIVTWQVARGGSIKPGDVAGSKDHKGYLHMSIFYNMVGVHRVVWALHYGEWPLMDLDHINRDGCDNRIANLRLATRTQNNANRGMMASNTHGDRGVTKLPSGKWQAQITVNRKNKYLGCFAEKADAIAAYALAATASFGEFASKAVKP